MSKNFLEFQFEVTQVIAEISGVKSKMERKKGISAQKMPPKSRTQLEIKCLKGYGTVKSLGTTGLENAVCYQLLVLGVP